MYGTGRDPLTGEPLGRPYPTYRPTAERIAERIARLPDTLAAAERAEAITQIEAQEAARPVRSAVAGYDLTFTVPKSVSVLAHGAIATGFDHFDTRAGDPNLHTHLVIANKVQGHDGQWRAVDGRALYNTAVACSELYDSALADLLAQRLPVAFGYRDRGPRRTAAYELDRIPDALLEAFSSRSRAITTETQDLVAAFIDAHGRDPD